MIVRSGKWLARLAKPSAPIGEPMRNSGMSLPVPGRTSYVSVTPGTSRVRVVGSVLTVMVLSFGSVGPFVGWTRPGRGSHRSDRQSLYAGRGSAGGSDAGPGR